MKKIIGFIVIVLVVLLALGLAKDLIIKVGIEQAVGVVTGLKMSIGGLKVGILKTLVDIKNLQLFNPAGFQDHTMLNMPEIYVNYDLPAIIGGKVHLPEVRIALREFLVVKNSDGRLNLDSLKVVQAEKTGTKPAGKAPEIQIDKLTLDIGKVIYKDYTRGGAPLVKEFNINLHESYTNIRDPYSLISLIVVKALMNTTIADLANFDVSGLAGSITDTLGSAQKVAAQAVTTAKKTAESVKEAAGALKDVFKNPFGGSSGQ